MSETNYRGQYYKYEDGVYKSEFSNGFHVKYGEHLTEKGAKNQLSRWINVYASRELIYENLMVCYEAEQILKDNNIVNTILLKAVTGQVKYLISRYNLPNSNLSELIGRCRPNST